MGLKLSIYYIEKVAEGNRPSRRSSFALDSFKIIANIKQLHAGRIKKINNWGCGAAGSVLEWHSRGRGFDPRQLHFYLKRG